MLLLHRSGLWSQLLLAYAASITPRKTVFILEAKERIPNPLNDSKEFLNLFAYGEMKRQGMTDQEIMGHYKITSWKLYNFKSERGLLRMKKGAVIHE